MADSDHALLAPSSADRLMMCAGSRRLAAMFPQEETIESREGTAAHWALSELLNRRDVAVGQIAANGVTLTDEMVECAEDTADYIADRDGLYPAAIETLIKNPTIHQQNYGTPDYATEKPYEIIVDDYKHGHKYVEVERNYQLINYALLKLADMRSKGQVVSPGARVRMTIHQPRAYHAKGAHRERIIVVRDLEEYIEPMRRQFALAMLDDAPCVASDPAICEHCPGRHACSAATAAGYNGVTHAYASTPLRMSPAAIGLELRILRRAQLQLKARISGLEEQANRLIKMPGGLPGWRVEFAQGRLIWNEAQAPINVIINTGAALGLKLDAPGIITPTQAIKAGLPLPLIDAWTRRQSGSAALVEDDGTLAARIFSKT